MADNDSKNTKVAGTKRNQGKRKELHSAIKSMQKKINSRRKDTNAALSGQRDQARTTTPKAEPAPTVKDAPKIGFFAGLRKAFPGETIRYLSDKKFRSAVRAEEPVKLAAAKAELRKTQYAIGIENVRDLAKQVEENKKPGQTPQQAIASVIKTEKNRGQQIITVEYTDKDDSNNPKKAEGKFNQRDAKKNIAYLEARLKVEEVKTSLRVTPTQPVAASSAKPQLEQSAQQAVAQTRQASALKRVAKPSLNDLTTPSATPVVQGNRNRSNARSEIG